MLKTTAMELPFNLEMSDLELGLDFGQAQLFDGQIEENEILLPVTQQDQQGQQQQQQLQQQQQWFQEDLQKGNDNQHLFLHKEQDILEKIVQDMQIQGQQEEQEAEVMVNVASPFQVMPVQELDQSDLIPAVIDTKPSPSPSSSCSDAQSLIEEMEEFLNSQNLPQEQVVTDEQTTEEDAREAEKLLDALIKGEVGMEDEQVSNVTEFQTSDDGNIIIVIANDSEVKSVDTFSITSEEEEDEESSVQMMDEDTSDSDWSPSPSPPSHSTKAVGRKSRRATQISPDAGVTKRKRGPYNTKGRKNQFNIKDKKERKKMQNVVAARRYRDKKKNEQGQVEMVEADLVEKNNKLKETLAEMEGEVKTIKKLLVELGLVTIKA